MNWYETYDNVVALGSWMDEGGIFSDTSAMLQYFEKPWKWSSEWELYQLYQQVGKDDFHAHNYLYDCITEQTDIGTVKDRLGIS